MKSSLDRFADPSSRAAWRRSPLGLLPATLVVLAACGGDAFSTAGGPGGGAGGTAGAGGSGGGSGTAGSGGAGATGGTAGMAGSGGSGAAGSGGAAGQGGSGGTAGAAGSSGAAGAGGSPGVAPVVAWAHAFAGEGNQYVGGLEASASGDVIVAGHFEKSLVGGISLTSAGGFDIFVSRVRDSGVIVWTTSFGGVSNEFVTGATLDGADRSYLVGLYDGGLAFGEMPPLQPATDGKFDGYLARLEPPGNASGSIGFNGSGNQEPQTVLAGGFGALVGGGFAGDGQFGSATFAHQGAGDAFLLRAFAGTDDWAFSFGDDKTQAIRSVATSGTTAMVTVGEVAGEVSLENGMQCSSIGGSDVLYARWDWSTRAAVTLRCFGDAQDQGAEAVAMLPDGGAVVAGWFFGALDLGGAPLLSAGDKDIFVARFAPDDSLMWAKRFGAPNVDDEVWDVDVDDKGNVYFGGMIRGALDFGGTSWVHAGGGDAFVARLGPDGSDQWVMVFGDDEMDLFRELAVDSDGSVYGAGHFKGNLSIGTDDLVSLGDVDSFLVKIDQVPN